MHERSYSPCWEITDCKSSLSNNHGWLMKKLALLLVFGCSMSHAVGPSGGEIYTYDARGRLETIKYTDGTKQTYLYDAAGNRSSIGQEKPASGKFSLVGGYVPTQSQQTGYVDIKNTGVQIISSISAVCTGANWPVTVSPASIAVGATARYQFLVLAPGGNPCKLKLTATTADNSPFVESTY